MLFELRLAAQPLAELFLFVDLRVGPEPMRDRLFAVAHGERAREVPTVGAVLAPQAKLGLIVFARAKRMGPSLEAVWQVIRMDELRPAAPEHLILADPEVF